jgi:hypothetical protein
MLFDVWRKKRGAWRFVGQVICAKATFPLPHPRLDVAFVGAHFNVPRVS